MKRIKYWLDEPLWKIRGEYISMLDMIEAVGWFLLPVITVTVLWGVVALMILI